jgi:hypothetical protein
MREISREKVKKRGKDVDVVVHELAGEVPVVQVEATLGESHDIQRITIGPSDGPPVGPVDKDRLQQIIDEARARVAETVAVREEVRAALKQIS